MKHLLFILITLIGINAHAQYQFDVGVTVGSAGYLGEIGGGESEAKPFVLDLKLSQARWNLGGFARYRIIDNLYVRADLMTIRLQGADSLSQNPERNSRNLSFRNDIIEFTGRVEYSLISIHDFGNTGRYLLDFKTNLILGAGVFYNNPKALYNGSYVSLRPLQTEGVKYSAFQFTLPVGAGLFWTYKRQHRIGVEAVWRFTLTDYIDDVSSTYPNDTTGMSPEAIALSNRNPELSESPINRNNYGSSLNPDYENIRGSPKGKDSYLVVSVSYSTVLRGSYKNKRFQATRSRSSIGSSKKRLKRRTRAKF